MTSVIGFNSIDVDGNWSNLVFTTSTEWRKTCEHANFVVGNNEKPLVNGDVNEKITMDKKII